MGSGLGAVVCSRSEFGPKFGFGFSGVLSCFVSVLSSRLGRKGSFSLLNIIGSGCLAMCVISSSKMTFRNLKTAPVDLSSSLYLLCSK